MDLGNFSNREVISIVRGEGELGKIISSPLDVDRADYLVRDSHYTGVAYGVIDLERLIQSFEISNGKVVLSEKGIKAAETLLFARFAMYPTVYLHHVSRIADAMLTRAVLSCFLDRTLSIEELSKMDDFDLISFLRRQEGIPSKIMRMIDERNLYKRVVYLSRMDMDDDFFELLTNLRSNGIKKIVEIENELASEFNLRNGDLLIDVFPSPSF
ncbi:phosphodiesterase, partial [Candidatus Bathyarchaeota archaeon ex4484_205]